MLVSRILLSPCLLVVLLLPVAACSSGTGNGDEGDLTSDTLDGDVACDSTNPALCRVDCSGDRPQPSADMRYVPPAPEANPDEWPDSPGAYHESMGPVVAYISELSIPDVTEDSCCRNWGERSKSWIRSQRDVPDNALSALNTSVQNLSPDVDNREAAATLTSTEFIMLLDHRELVTPDADQDFTLTALPAAFGAMTTPEDAAAGAGSFLIERSSFIEGTGAPRYSFPEASLQDGQLSSGSSTIQLVWPFTNHVLLPFPLQDAVFTAALDESNDEPAPFYADGELSGYVTPVDILEAVNEKVRNDCGCLGLNGSLYEIRDGHVVSDLCLPLETALERCSDPNQLACVQMAASVDPRADSCLILPGLLNGAADLDLDGDCQISAECCDYEALSVGLRFSAVPANVTGLEP